MSMKSLSKAQMWAARMAAFETSGQGRRVWCAAQGLNVNTFAYWHRRLSDLASASKPAQSPATTTAMVPVLTRSPSASSIIEFEWPGGLRLRASLGANTVELSALVRAFWSC